MFTIKFYFFVSHQIFYRVDHGAKFENKKALFNDKIGNQSLISQNEITYVLNCSTDDALFVQNILNILKHMLFHLVKPPSDIYIHIFEYNTDLIVKSRRFRNIMYEKIINNFIVPNFVSLSYQV